MLLSIINLFEQHIDAVVLGRAIAQLADVHARAQADVLTPVKRAYACFSIVVGGHSMELPAAGLVLKMWLI